MGSENKRRGDERTAGVSVSFEVPAADADLYRYGATDGVLRVLVDAPDRSYGIRELARATDYAPRSVSNAVEMLSANGVVRTEPAGNRTGVRLVPNRVSIPDDPVLRVPQAEFHAPVRAALERLREGLDGLAGIVLFGSVARGEADRRSDIDLWVLVEAARGTNQRRAADVVDELEGRRFGGDRSGEGGRTGRADRGDRYEFEVLVESTASAGAHADDLDRILGEGITLYGTEALREFEREVLADG